ncbi:MAG TPA: hypothetical protein VKZ55_04460 [Microthrixaceae bacterium]|nr:hypothetical protein [Microthrixaceae bacterium]
MSLADRLKAGPPSRRTSVCTVSTVLDQLDPRDADALRTMLHPESGWTGTDIARALRDDLGVPTTSQTINRHRRGDCLCPATTEEEQA